jgi:short-subunit dehydrogenase
MAGSEGRAASTALVTGAAGGLGSEFARQLARAGWTVVLVGRDADRLRETAAELETPAEVLVADLAEAAGLDRVHERLADSAAPVDLLVNNAGTLGHIAPLADQPVQSQAHLIDVDLRAVVRLCGAVLPGMVVRRRGGILNVSSIMAFLPAPQAATYGAAKSFVNSFTESLHCEVRRFGVHVTALCPGSVRTGLHRSSGRRGGRLGPYLEPDRVVREGLAAVRAGRLLCVPGTSYRVTAAMSRLAPRALVRGWVHRRFGD